jgi:hypothetical protein
MRRFSPLAVSLLVLLTFAPAAWAVSPDVGVINPTGFQIGTEIEATFSGARLADAQELLFYSPGIDVTELKADSETVVKAKLKISPQCRLGIHAVRLRSATGISNLRTFTVGPLAEVPEQEPNTDFAAPQAVPFGCTVSGVVQNEDVDHFLVEAKQGERITAELEGIRLGYTFFDPYLAILNSERFELARSDDAALLRQDCLCAVVAPADGKYIVQVRESAYGGNGSCLYRLHVGKFPRPTAVLPAGGRPSEALTVRWLGDPAGEWTEQVTLPSTEDLAYGLFAKDAIGVSPSPNVIRVTDLANALEAEPNDTTAQASAGVAPGALNGIIEQPGDVDFFKFSAKQGQQYDIRVLARIPLRSPLDPVLVVHRANGAGLASNDDSGGPDAYLRFNAPADEDYFIQVYDHLRAGGPTFVYRVEITPVKPALTMTLPEVQQYVPVVLPVPRGNRMALMINAARDNWGGDLNVTLEGLPPGLTFQTVPMTADRTTIPVLCTAAADAPLDGTLTQVIGRPADANLPIVGQLEQRTMLVRGQNNVDVWGHTADRMAAAVTDAVPLEIEIVQPQAPIARQGSMQLKVVAKRQDGFAQPIAMRLLYAPPGIAASGSISIPGDKNEGEIPLTANANAAIGTWPLIVIGTATVGNGGVEVASQMAQLTISDSYFSFVFDKAAGELNQETQMVVKVEKKLDFEGEATAELLGLPANTSVKPEPLKFTKDSTELVFPIKIDQTAKPGVYKTLVCRAVVTQNGEPVTHTLGTGELRVDEPLPPKPAAPQPAAQPQAQAPPPPQPATAEPPKRLSRLEQLRLEKMKQSEDAGK